MLRRPTTLILGAGASYDLQFPLGVSLMAAIQSELDSYLDGAPRAFLSTAIRLGGLGGQDAEARQSAEILSNGLGTAKSIDSYLNRMAHDQLLGDVAKLCIAKAIIEAEWRSAQLLRSAWQKIPFRLDRDRRVGFWLHDLMVHVLRDVRKRNLDSELETALSNLSIVTFNYDRSVEYFAADFTARAFNLPPEEALDLMKAHLRIVHVYGSTRQSEKFGNLFQQFARGTDDPPPRDRDVAACALDATKGLRTIYESAVNKAALDRAKGLIGNAHTVLLIGNSYIEENFKLIAARGFAGKEYYGTCVDLSAHAIGEATRLLGEHFDSAKSYDLRAEWTAQKMIADLLVTL